MDVQVWSLLGKLCGPFSVGEMSTIAERREDGAVEAVEAMEVIGNANADEEVPDELEMEYENIQELTQSDDGDKIISGYQNILQNNRTDDLAMKIKEKAIYGFVNPFHPALLPPCSRETIFTPLLSLLPLLILLTPAIG
jgi:hypothetical protein